MNDCSPKTGTPVLLIEDTPSLRLVYESALKNAGLPVLSVATAADGLRAFRSSVPCAVLLDLMLPDREGIDLLAELRVLRPETPVIVITANGSVNKAVEAMRAGRGTPREFAARVAAVMRWQRRRWGCSQYN